MPLTRGEYARQEQIVLWGTVTIRQAGKRGQRSAKNSLGVGVSSGGSSAAYLGRPHLAAYLGRPHGLLGRPDSLGGTAAAFS